MIALLAPGQGAQTPGMLAPWLELDGVEQRLSSWSTTTRLDLIRLGTTAEADEIKDTAVTQPLIVALSLIAAEQLDHRATIPASGSVAGHSIGEFTAAAIAGTFSFDDAMTLAAVRGREMAAACALEPTGMSAVMGGDPDSVVAHLEHLGLEPANRNGAGQIAAAGRLPALEELASEPPEGTRVRPLPVAGAFHTRFMAPAEQVLGQHVEKITPADPRTPMLSNADGAVVTNGTEVVNRLVTGVTKPVRWDSCMATLAERGVDTTIELPPGKTLTGLVRRELTDMTTLALKTPDDLDKAAELITQHAANSAAEGRDITEAPGSAS